METGEKVGSNEMGELAAKTPFLMKEYLNKPEVILGLLFNYQHNFLPFFLIKPFFAGVDEKHS